MISSLSCTQTIANDYTKDLEKKNERNISRLILELFSAKLCCPNKIIVKSSLVNYIRPPKITTVYHSFQSSLHDSTPPILPIFRHAIIITIINTIIIHFHLSNRHDSKIDRCSIPVHNQTFILTSHFRTTRNIEHFHWLIQFLARFFARFAKSGGATNLGGAYFVTFSVASAESAAIRRDRIDASPDRECDAGTTGS